MVTKTTGLILWWERPWALMAIAALSFVPMLLVDTPPLVDFPGHMGRYYIALTIHDNPVLQDYWTYDWKIVANLGVDLLMVPLARLMGVERAAWMIAAILAPVMIWGMFRVSRAIHGAVQPAAIAAAVFATAFPYQMGFVNYWLSVGLALHLLASWIRSDTPDKRGVLQAALFVAAACLLWLCHVYGWAIALIWIGGYEAGKLFSKHEWRDLHRLPSAFAQIVLRSAPIMAPLILMLVRRSRTQGAVTSGWMLSSQKLGEIGNVLRDQNPAIVLLGLAMAICVIWASLRSKMFGFNSQLVIAGLALLLCFVLLPFRLFGSAFADERLIPVIFITFLLALGAPDKSPSDTRFPAHAVAWIALVFFTLRTAVGAVGYYHYRTDYSSHLKALDTVERGARILVLSASRCNDPWRSGRTQHLGSLAIVRKDAFVNTQWDVPGAQLLTVRFAPGTPYRTDPSQYLVDGDCDGDLRPELKAALHGAPTDLFDYVWLFRMGSAAIDNPSFKQVFADSGSSLLRVQHSVTDRFGDQGKQK